MAVGMKDIVRFGKETTRGVAAASLALHHPFNGNGLVPSLKHAQGELPSSSSWPYIGEQTPLGLEASLQFEPDITTATIRDIILMACRDAQGDLPSLTIGHNQSGVGDARFLGCVCSQLDLNFSRSGGSPDEGSILQGNMSFECMQAAEASGIVAGTQAIGNKFQLRFSQITVNDVTSTKLMSVRVSHTNELDLGAPDGNNARIYLQEGRHTNELVVSAYFETEAWRELVANATEHEVELVLATGQANETVTGTMNSVRASQFAPSRGQVVTLQEITLRPNFDGTNAPIVWSFGTGIGASQLSLG